MHIHMYVEWFRVMRILRTAAYHPLIILLRLAHPRICTECPSFTEPNEVAGLSQMKSMCRLAIVSVQKAISRKDALPAGSL